MSNEQHAAELERIALAMYSPEGTQAKALRAGAAALRGIERAKAALRVISDREHGTKFPAETAAAALVDMERHHEK